MESAGPSTPDSADPGAAAAGYLSPGFLNDAHLSSPVPQHDVPTSEVDVPTVTVEQIEAARERLKGTALVTPMEGSRWLSAITGTDVHLKCENLQRTGSFKIRGAYTRISGLTDEERARGVVAASAGNHAQGVALAAATLGIHATVFMPHGA